MAPVFLPDDYVIGIRWWQPALHLWCVCLRQPPTYRVGDVLLIQHPNYGRIIKRVTAVDNNHATNGDVRYTLAGDNTANSVSSEDIGSTITQQIIGKVVAHIRKPRSSCSHHNRQ